MNESIAERHAAWNNPTWVSTVMCYPHEMTLLEYVAAGNETQLVHKKAWSEEGSEAVRAGKVAGKVLSTLYALECAGWDLPCEPSFALAVHFTEQLAYEDRNPGA